MTTSFAGSHWHKWDLHVHAPSCALNNQFRGATLEEKWADYLECIEAVPDISVLGITDYFSIEGYQRLLVEKHTGRLPNVDLLIPNVELRIIPVTGDSNPINLHVLFDPDPAVVNNLGTYFFQNLEFAYAGNNYRCTQNDLIRLGRAYKGDQGLDERSAYKEGVNQFKVTHKQLRDVLRKNEHLSGKYLIGVSNRSSDGNSGIQHSNLAATRQEIYRLSHFIFSANPSDREYFLGQGVDTQEKVESDYGSLKPCFHGSDAHKLEDICEPDGSRYTWIKADTTFEGLKQTIYEPEARVRIQTTNPQHDYPKHYFASLTIEGKPFDGESLEFATAEIPLNRDLVTIIGGRGTGKSMLLDTLYHMFNRGDDDTRLRAFQSIPFSVELRKGATEEEETFSLSDEAEQFDYLHVRQGHVKGLVDRSDNLHKEVLRLLGPSDFKVDMLFEEELAGRNEDIAQLREFLCSRDEAKDFVNSVEYHERQIRQNQALLKTLTTDETKQQVDAFTENSKQLSFFDTFIQDLTRLRSELNKFVRDANENIEVINKQLSENESMYIPAVDFSKQLEQIGVLFGYASTKQGELREGNSKIETDAAQKGFKGDIANLLSKADAYQRAVQQSQEAIKKINTTKERLTALIQARRDSVTQIKMKMDSERDDIAVRFEAKQAGVDQLSADHKALLQSLLKDIDIRGAVVFNQERFVDGLWDFIDGRKFRSTTTKTKNQRIAETLGVKTPDDFFHLLAGESVIKLDTDGLSINIDEFIKMPDLLYEGKEKELFDYLFLRKQRTNYLRIVPTAKYQGKDLQRVSVGQRGTFYLCLKLATESFSTPFVFDQPEDDLDNEFIIDHLLPIFREIKKYRQVIIATHNANLVVNADSEQILIATNLDEVLKYEAGALENPIIRSRICDILEGGEKAFLKREKRYGIRSSTQ